MTEKAQPAHITPMDIARVMEVAGSLFAQHGYDGVGIREIAAESGVKTSSILYHFNSKAQLFEEILDHKYKAFFELASNAIKPLTDPKQKMECILGTVYDALLNDQTFLLLMQRDVVDMIAQRHRPAFVEGYAKYFALMNALLQDTLNRPIERRAVFSLISVLVGYAEFAAALRKSNLKSEDEDRWYAQQRKELVTVGMYICQM